MGAVDLWGEQLRAWAIPEEILSQAPESPWGFPPELFRSRADTALARTSPSPSTLRAVEALPQDGTVLDVGVGGGAASLPLASRAARIVGVDSSGAMLEEFLGAAAEVGLSAGAVQGGWPEVAGSVEPADVVVCHHVLYNVQELGPFASALTDHASRRVVVEITDRHPLSWMSDLWLRFHGLERPSGPTADDCEAALAELGIHVGREDHEVDSGRGGFARREDAIALVRRRLCLPAERDAEVASALGRDLREREGLWSAGPKRQMLVTLWWDGGA